MKKIAVILAGCGSKDGAEITEAVSTLLTLSELKVQFDIFAPDVEINVTNHLNGASSNETRNVLVESARIARGQIKDLVHLKTDDYDGVVFPGGYGVARSLCTWGKDGAKCEVLPDAKRVIEEFYSQAKPICAICIAPALIARVLGHYGINLTLGQGSEASLEITKTGASHVKCAATDYVSDRESKIITTPAYMCDATPFEVYTGIRKALHEMVEMA
ncbi:MAG: isoprenoid biosynthesis glyoxalase ElbB [Bdellovibrionales bacterium]|nr:isoprenoid biosynthesis glyoxalase ElbB [Bdellovibrionales bacterium]